MKVSIVVPSYNHADYLPLTINSVLAQSFENWQLVVVDDGSQDQTINYLETVRDPRIAWHLNQENLGTYGTLNKAIGLSQGEYIAVLNSDDLWQPRKLEKQLDALQRYPETDVCYTFPHQVMGDGSPRTLQDQHGDWPTTESHSLVSEEIVVNRILASSILFRRGAVRFDPRYRYSGDWIAMLSCARRGPFCFVNEILTSWRIHPTNAHKELEKTIIEEIAIRQAVLDKGEWWKVGHASWEDTISSFGGSALRLQSLYLLCGDHKRAGTCLQQAFNLGARNTTLTKRLKYSWLPLRILRNRIWPGSRFDQFERLYAAGLPPAPSFA